jgi:hypothetical protein
MRLWQFWCQILMFSSQDNPPRFIELIMLLLAMVLLAIWVITERSPFLILSLSYAVGASTSILVRESLFPSRQLRLIHLTAVLLLVVSFYSLALSYIW